MDNKIIKWLKDKQEIIIVLILMTLLISNCNQKSREKETLKLLKETQNELVETKYDVNRRIDSLFYRFEFVTRIEGLKAEKRMIQSTDRKLWDRERQSEIDKELEKLKRFGYGLD